MHIIISGFLIFFASWTVSVHISLITCSSLLTAICIFPLFLIIFLLAYYALKKQKRYGFCDAISGYISPSKCIWKQTLLVCLILLSLLSLLFSYNIFLVISLLVVSMILLYGKSQPLCASKNFSLRKNNIVFLVLFSLGIILSFAVIRSDLDDSFYVAVAANAASNASSSQLAGDPMLGEIGFPLIFASYRWATFELLSGALGYLFSVPAMDFYYIYLLPFWVIITLAANFLLIKEYDEENWLLACIVFFFLSLLLGEMHRGVGNFSFVRLFQGKAVFLSALVPCIFYFTSRYASIRGTKVDIFLLICCQVSAIGMSNFGILMGPIAGIGAVLSNMLLLKNRKHKILYILLPLFIPIPYLVQIYFSSKGGPVFNYGVETAANVWLSVMGNHQQYFVGALLLAGPAFAKERITQWRLAIPVFLLFAIYLNPLLSTCISHNITTPPVYWRVVWSFPIITFISISFCIFIKQIIRGPYISLALCLVIAVCFFASVPYNVFRAVNIDAFGPFASWKIKSEQLSVAKYAVKVSGDWGRLLAPDEIAGVVSRFEDHPVLVSTRGFYLDLMKPALNEIDYNRRHILHEFIVGRNMQDIDEIKHALVSLKVAVIVLRNNLESRNIISLFTSNNYEKLLSINGYAIWKKKVMN